MSIGVVRTICLVAAVTAGCAIGGAQPAGSGPAGPTVEISGKISKITMVPGQGTPAIEVKSSSGRVWTVWLGSMRYLVEKNFNPKAGQAVSVKGYERADCPGSDKKECDDLLAASVTLTDTGQTVRLRDETGRPVWRCMRCGQKN